MSHQASDIHFDGIVFSGPGGRTTLGPHASIELSAPVDGIVHAILTVRRTFSAVEVETLPRAEAIVVGWNSVDGLAYAEDDPISVRTVINNVVIPVEWVGQYKSVWSAEFDLDTKMLINGWHTYQLVARLTPFQLPNTFAGTSRDFFVDNPSGVIGVQTEYGEIRLLVSQTFTLKTNRAYNTESLVAVPVGEDVDYVSSNPAKVSVGAGAQPAWCLLTAVAAGEATITCTYGDYTATCLVVVTAAAVACRHFSRGGDILTTYDPLQSLIPRSIFHSSAQWIDITLAGGDGFGVLLGADIYKAAGMNAFEEGLDNDLLGMISGGYTLQQAKDYADSDLDPDIEYAVENDLCIVQIGDNQFTGAARIEAILHGTVWMQDYLAYFIQAYRDSGLVINIQCSDEANIGGITDPLTDADLAELKGVFDTLDMPAYTWPVLGITGVTASLAWMGPAFSTCATNYQIEPYIESMPFWSSVRSEKLVIDSSFLARRSIFPVDWLWSVLVPISGAYYSKEVSGSEFQFYRDQLIGSRTTPENIIAHVGITLAYGALGFRFYKIEQYYTKAYREAAPIGEDMSIGCRPDDDPTRWSAMSSAANLVAAAEPDLLQPMSSAINVGPDFLTGAKSGTRSQVLIVVNLVNAPRIASINLTPYATVGEQIFEYSASVSGGYSTIEITETEFQTSFAAGELKVFVCDKSQVVLKDNLVAYYKSDEASGNLIDAHNAHDGADQNTVGTTTGKIANARQYTAANSEFFIITHTAAWIPTSSSGPWGMCCWIWADSLAGYMAIVSKGGNGYEFRISDANTPQIVGGAAEVVATWGSALSTGQWYFLAAWYDDVADEVNIQVNNATKVSGAGVPTINNTGNIGVGARPAGSLFFDGRIDDLAIWMDRFPTPSELTEIYNGGAGLGYDDWDV